MIKNVGRTFGKCKKILKTAEGKMKRQFLIYHFEENLDRNMPGLYYCCLQKIFKKIPFRYKNEISITHPFKT